MKKLFVVALMSAALVACGKKKKDEEAKDMTPPPTAEPAKTTEPAKPAEPVKAEEKAASDLPKECQDYKDAVAKLATCDKLDAATRETLKKSYDAASASWDKVAAEHKADLARDCKAGAEAVMSAAKNICGW
jgi:hypothetical protein